MPNTSFVGYAWTRDDAAIIFGKDRNGDEQNNLYRLDLTAQQVEQLNDDPRSQEHPWAVSPDNRTLLVASNRAGQMHLAFSANETANLQNRDLYLMRADGSEMRRLLSLKEGSGEHLAAWHPGGRLAAVTTDFAFSNRPWILDMTTGEGRALGLRHRRTVRPGRHPPVR